MFTATEADGTGETDWIPVPSDPSWFRETRQIADLTLTLGHGRSFRSFVGFPNSRIFLLHFTRTPAMFSRTFFFRIIRTCIPISCTTAFYLTPLHDNAFLRITNNNYFQSIWWKKHKPSGSPTVFHTHPSLEIFCSILQWVFDITATQSLHSPCLFWFRFPKTIKWIEENTE